MKTNLFEQEHYFQGYKDAVKDYDKYGKNGWYGINDDYHGDEISKKKKAISPCTDCKNTLMEDLERKEEELQAEIDKKEKAIAKREALLKKAQEELKAEQDKLEDERKRIEAERKALNQEIFENSDIAEVL